MSADVSLDNVRIVARATDMREGLFGQVLLYVLEILPAVRAAGVQPDWDIRSALYGRVIPGVVDLAYDVPASTRRDVDLRELRRSACFTLGNDFDELGRLWQEFFRIPERVIRAADAVSTDLSDAIGIHYRGNDKLLNSWDSNPITHSDYLVIVRDALERRSELRRVFVATDDHAFSDAVGEALGLEVLNLGPVTFHKQIATGQNLGEKADRALLDCLLLSRCAMVLQTSSALPSFTKVLNPGLEIYRVAASKWYSDIPYFPAAYIPKFVAGGVKAAAVVERAMRGDWTQDPRASQYTETFAFRPRVIRRSLKQRVLDAIRP